MPKIDESQKAKIIKKTIGRVAIEKTEGTTIKRGGINLNKIEIGLTIEVKIEREIKDRGKKVEIIREEKRRLTEQIKRKI